MAAPIAFPSRMAEVYRSIHESLYPSYRMQPIDFGSSPARKSIVAMTSPRQRAKIAHRARSLEMTIFLHFSISDIPYRAFDGIVIASVRIRTHDLMTEVWIAVPVIVEKPPGQGVHAVKCV